MRALRKVFITLAAFFGIALVVSITWGIIWLVQIESFPTPAIPTPKMPAHNAFNTLQAASKLLVRGDDIHDAATIHTHYTIAQRQALVAYNSAALAKLDPALSQPYYNAPVRAFDQLIPYYAGFRNLAQLLRVKSEVEAAHGRWQDSAESGLDAIRMGEQIPHGSTIIGDLVGIACETIGRRTVWSSVDHLSASEARTDIAKLQNIQVSEVSLSEVFQQEEWTGQAGILDMASKDSRMRTDLAGNIILQSSLYNYSHYMNQIVRNTRLPYGHLPPNPPIPHDFITPLIAPVYTPMALKYTENETQNQLLVTSFALQAYKLDHGAYPTSLNQLVPAYLKTVPNDPFALNAPLRYRPSGATYVLYSVGPDGIDDGGKPIINYPTHYNKKTISDGKPNYFVEQDSKGDIVAGVNF